MNAGSYNHHHTTGSYAGESHDMDYMTHKIAYAVAVKRTLEDCYHMPELQAIGLLSTDGHIVARGQRTHTLPSDCAAALIKRNM